MPTPDCKRCATAPPSLARRRSCCRSEAGPRSPRPTRDAIEASPLIAEDRLKDETDEVKAEAKKLRDEIKWVWPKVRDHLIQCGVLIGPSGIEIRPYHPSTGAERRLRAWFRRLGRTVTDLKGHERTADDTDRFFLAWDEWRREVGGRLDHVHSEGVA
jgi:hypothetical protein